MRWFRRRGLPAAVRASLPLQPGERVIAHATTRDDEFVVATGRALYLPDGQRVGWHRIEHATWKNGWLHVREVVTGGGGPAPEHHLRLTEPRALPDAVRERVTATIVVNRYSPLVGERGVRVVGRRLPGTDSIGWTLVFDPGLDPDDPGLRAMAEQVLEDVRHQTGA